MICRMTINDLENPVNLIVNLNEIQDPFVQETLYDLAQRAFKVGMPYFAIAVADLGDSSYVCYDAVNYRIGKHNGYDDVTNFDPLTRKSIRQVHYFAIERKDNFNTLDAAEAVPYPPKCYYPKALTSGTDFPEDKIERYAFSALNYAILEEGDKDYVTDLYRIHLVVHAILEVGSVENSNCHLEQKKWSEISYSSSMLIQ